MFSNFYTHSNYYCSDRSTWSASAFDFSNWKQFLVPFIYYHKYPMLWLFFFSSLMSLLRYGVHSGKQWWFFCFYLQLLHSIVVNIDVLICVSLYLFLWIWIWSLLIGFGLETTESRAVLLIGLHRERSNVEVCDFFSFIWMHLFSRFNRSSEFGSWCVVCFDRKH